MDSFLIALNAVMPTFLLLAFGYFLRNAHFVDGAYLKKTVPNPSRRSAGHVRQSRFEGSRRQKRAEVVRMLLAARDAEPAGLSFDEVLAGLDAFEHQAGREPVERSLVEELLGVLTREGFCAERDGRWLIA